MAPQVWGTFSVRDHCRPEAFLREVLLFDRLAIPYPDSPHERDRWRQPNPKRDPTETWDPERLDRLLAVVGTDAAPGYNDARLAWPIQWNQGMWDDLRARPELAAALTGDAFMDTRIVVPASAQMPKGVDAVAAYRSEADWREETLPVSEPPGDVSAAEALVQLSRPLLLPTPSGDELDDLRRAVDLAHDPDYVAMRAAYHAYFRELLGKLIGDGDDLDDVRVDPATMRWAQDELQGLWARERALVAASQSAERWRRLELGCVTVGTLGAVGLALAAAMPVVGVGAGLLSFAGWAVNQHRRPPPKPQLGGASMFVEAWQRLGWDEPAFDVPPR